MPKRIIETFEGTLYFVCRGDRHHESDAVLQVFSEKHFDKAEQYAAARRNAEVVEEEGLFMRVREAEGGEIIGWQGPFDTIGEAYDHMRDEFQLDPETGEDLDECGDPLEDEDDVDHGDMPVFDDS